MHTSSITHDVSKRKGPDSCFLLDWQSTDALRTALPKVDASSPPLEYTIIAPRFEANHYNSTSLGDEKDGEGILQGVLTSRIEKEESRGSDDWRQGLLRDKISRLNTVRIIAPEFSAISAKKL